MNIITFFSDPSVVHGGLIIGLEARVSSIENKMSDLDARGREESDNLANERNLDRFIMSGNFLFNKRITSQLSRVFISPMGEV